ncbi:MAG: hypothetical protein M1817_006878 [Caeruleum heppii]|nr:MAG: hypothetical protein M1817_006878 [Caeruleum heppii]
MKRPTRSTLLLLSFLFTSTHAVPQGPVIDQNFPDPSIIELPSGDHYSFATSGYNHNSGKSVQIAHSADFDKWTVLDIDGLPELPSWTFKEKPAVWAPDVVQRPDGKFVMYFSAAPATSPEQHCVGVALADSITGPYIDNGQYPFVCPLEIGGALDAAGFMDDDGAMYVLYKIDGNSLNLGPGNGPCGNTVPPLKPTPIMIQRVADDGFSKIGEPWQLIDRDDGDGAMVEAPSLARISGKYVLFFAAGCWSTEKYTVSYATAESLRGPFVKGTKALLGNGQYQALSAPGDIDEMEEEELIPSLSKRVPVIPRKKRCVEEQFHREAFGQDRIEISQAKEQRVLTKGVPSNKKIKSMGDQKWGQLLYPPRGKAAA